MMKQILIVIGLNTGAFGIFAGFSYGYQFLASMRDLKPFMGFWENGFVGGLFFMVICGILSTVTIGILEIVKLKEKLKNGKP